MSHSPWNFLAAVPGVCPFTLRRGAARPGLPPPGLRRRARYAWTRASLGSTRRSPSTRSGAASSTQSPGTPSRVRSWPHTRPLRAAAMRPATPSRMLRSTNLAGTRPTRPRGRIGSSSLPTTRGEAYGSRNGGGTPVASLTRLLSCSARTSRESISHSQAPTRRSHRSPRPIRAPWPRSIRMRRASTGMCSGGRHHSAASASNSVPMRPAEAAEPCTAQRPQMPTATTGAQTTRVELWIPPIAGYNMPSGAFNFGPCGPDRLLRPNQIQRLSELELGRPIGGISVASGSSVPALPLTVTWNAEQQVTAYCADLLDTTTQAALGNSTCPRFQGATLLGGPSYTTPPLVAGHQYVLLIRGLLGQTPIYFVSTTFTAR